jgi:endonuclease/exonuclease/phosphatase family metal-dependent hydrolase
MRILQLNLWLGKRFTELEAFLTAEASRTDVFCFQEVSHNEEGLTYWPGSEEYRADLLERLQEWLPRHDFFYVPSTTGQPLGSLPGAPTLSEGCAIAIRRDLSLFDRGSAQINGDSFDPADDLTRPRAMLWVVVPYGRDVITIANVHGLASHSPKSDNPRRLAQSRAINAALADLPEPLFLCGDFNLDPDTESRAILAEGRRDLIAQFDIASTRTPLFPAEFAKYADYAFCSKGLDVVEYEVIPVVVSDHYPLAAHLR